MEAGALASRSNVSLMTVTRCALHRGVRLIALQTALTMHTSAFLLSFFPLLELDLFLARLMPTLFVSRKALEHGKQSVLVIKNRLRLDGAPPSEAPERHS